METNLRPESFTLMQMAIHTENTKEYHVLVLVSIHIIVPLELIQYVIINYWASTHSRYLKAAAPLEFLLIAFYDNPGLLWAYLSLPKKGFSVAVYTLIF